ncbi:nucleotidyl transferase AbiEii/AbiGii toxin family protein [Parafilimonas sp.]|uniref:nucleotidyl transferase AbiEii/AbiGii toxin family protein n=1 Tax=Parafilimonas sp. TaxID=1969739 RepID=UPI0039E3DDA3
MIPRAYITEWGNIVPWKTNEQVEQDLVICRALTEIFSNKFLAGSLAFRGGTALHKLYLQPQPRYSEDIDLVQIRAEPIKETIQQLQKTLLFLGKSNVTPRKDNNTIYYKFESELAPVQVLKLKVETNCREHFSVLGWEKKDYEVTSGWFNGKSPVTTYKLEELLGTKLRALYQRRKGRDLYDLWKALTNANPNAGLIIQCYKAYIKFSLGKPVPTKKEFLLNIERKKTDNEFLGDTIALLRPDEKYNPDEAFQLVTEKLIEKM